MDHRQKSIPDECTKAFQSWEGDSSRLFGNFTCSCQGNLCNSGFWNPGIARISRVFAAAKNVITTEKAIADTKNEPSKNWSHLKPKNLGENSKQEPGNRGVKMSRPIIGRNLQISVPNGNIRVSALKPKNREEVFSQGKKKKSKDSRAIPDKIREDDNHGKKRPILIARKAKVNPLYYEKRGK